jgi:hypothetical protein
MQLTSVNNVKFTALDVASASSDHPLEIAL